LPPPSATLSEPRKSPVQARSTASVEAILEATVQVLLAVGKERLTTTRVAHRAGVSVGTLYQYFPNKRALLQAALRRHLEEITSVVEDACLQQHGKGLEQMVTAVVTAFLDAKMRSSKTSVAMYSVSSDLDGATIARQTGLHSGDAIAAMLESSPERLVPDSHLVAAMLTSAMAGVSRRLLESVAPEELFCPMKQELILLACAYLRECSARPPC